MAQLIDSSVFIAMERRLRREVFVEAILEKGAMFTTEARRHGGEPSDLLRVSVSPWCIPRCIPLKRA